MHAKTTFFRVPILIVIAVCASSFLIFQLALQSVAADRPRQVTHFLTQPHQESGLPVRLKIPSIKVDAVIESVGLTPKGAMDVPKDPNNVGWYSLGVRPGEKGNAVLAGHLDWYNGKIAVFQNLKNLHAGDLLSIETDKGRFFPFIVRAIRSYDPNEIAPEVFQKSDGIHLNLVTCGGLWDKQRRIYRERLVIFTDAVTP